MALYSYSAPPQKPDTLDPREMGTMEVVNDLQSRDKDRRANAREFLNLPINKMMPREKRKPSDGMIICSCCDKELPVSMFGDNPKKRNGKKSQCNKCQSHSRVVRYHNGKASSYSSKLSSTSAKV